MAAAEMGQEPADNFQHTDVLCSSGYTRNMAATAICGAPETVAIGPHVPIHELAGGPYRYPPGHCYLQYQSERENAREEGRTAALILIFALVTFLIILSSNNSEEPFNYKDLKIKHHNPPNIRKWGIQDGYIPVSGNKTLGSKCNSCVLVTSSSHLLNTGLGPRIDQAECIIRMNDAPTTGYEKDVGNKTTFRVVAHSSVYRVLRRPQEFLSRSPRQTLIFWGPPIKMLQNSKANLYHIIERASSAFPNVSAFVLSPRNMMRFDELFRAETGRDREKSHSWLSTGWFTMVIAVELCNNVHVYGMVPPNYCSKRQHKMPYHYYEPRGSDECTTYIQNERGRRGNHHRFITEKLVFARWASVYNISFSHPEWFKDPDNSN